MEEPANQNVTFSVAKNLKQRTALRERLKQRTAFKRTVETKRLNHNRLGVADRECRGITDFGWNYNFFYGASFLGNAS